MWPERDPYEHPILGRVLPVFCTGTHAFQHPRVTRRLDLKGHLWNISEWPYRRKLAPFEEQQRRQVLASIGRQNANPNVLSKEIFSKVFLRCTDNSLNGKRGCGELLKYWGPDSTNSNPDRRKLYQFYCARDDCEQKWERRLFDSQGREVSRNPVGGNRGHKVPVPTKARFCPACNEAGIKTELQFPQNVRRVGGRTYKPPLLKLTCPNPNGIDHRSPERNRQGLTFYYDRKNSRFVHVPQKSVKQGGPPRGFCRKHGPLRRNVYATARQVMRVPKWIREKLGQQLPIYFEYCAVCGTGSWFSKDRRKRVSQHAPPTRLKGSEFHVMEI